MFPTIYFILKCVIRGILNTIILRHEADTIKDSI